MKLDFCAICGETNDLNYHHFTPRISGGSDDETNILTLCYKHHCEIHGRKYYDLVNHKQLTKNGIQKAKDRGVKLGNPNLVEMNKTRKRKARIFAYEYQDEVLDLKSKGFSHTQICQEFMKKQYKTSGRSLIWHPVQISRIIAKSKTRKWVVCADKIYEYGV